MSSAVTVKDIAARAAVSVGTVSRVFNQHGNVTEEIRERVLRAARELGYNGRAGQRSSARTADVSLREIGFLFCPVNTGTIATANPFWSQILTGVEREASQSGLKLSYRSIDDLRHNPERMRAAVAEMDLNGMLLVGPFPRPAIAALQTLKIPAVLVVHYEPAIELDTVLEDNYEGMVQLVGYLLEQGHRAIAFIGGPPDPVHPQRNALHAIERRLEAYRATLASAGVAFNERLYVSSDLTPDGGYRACRELLDRRGDFSALVCANDSSALGAARALHEAGRRIPQDVSLVEFGDYLDPKLMSPPVTAIHFDYMFMGQLAVQRLRARVADPTAPCTTTLLRGSLLVRESVQRRTPAENGPATSAGT